MKIAPLRSRILVAASCLALPALAIAQSPAKPQTLDTAPSLTLAADSSASRKLPAFKSTNNTLKSVVESLQKILLTQNLEPINVLIAPGAEGIEMPALDLRNVSGSDALSLIASAASCVLDPIRSSDPGRDSIIGYRLNPASPPAFGTDFGLPARPGPKSSKDWTPSRGSGAASNTLALPTPTAVPSAIGLPGVANYGTIGSAAPMAGVETRVYPLGEIKATGAFSEIEKTLDDLLATSGLPQDQVKLAVHDKTNVLVVRGPGEAQVLVEQLLTALSKNNAETKKSDAEGNEQNATHKLTILELRMKTMADEMDRLRKQLDESDAQRRVLETQNQRLQDQVPKKVERQ